VIRRLFVVAVATWRGTTSEGRLSHQAFPCTIKAARKAKSGEPALRILIVEDDTKIASFLVRGLKQAGFAVDRASNGVDGLELALAEPYDAAVVDIMLPKLDGLALIDRLRHDKVMTPVIILSAKRSVDDRVKGLHSGGDDYLTKPFALSELVARIHALLGRASAVGEPTRLTVGPLVVDLLTRDVTRNGKRLELQSREFSLLEPDTQRRPAGLAIDDPSTCVESRL
jgi:two-component system, OmpR family, response regulator